MLRFSSIRTASICQDDEHARVIPQITPAALSSTAANGKNPLTGIDPTVPNFSHLTLNLAHDGTARVTVVADAWDDTMQFIEYVAVPQPLNRIVNAPAAEPGRICGYIMDFVDEYVYVCNNAPASYTGDWEEIRS